MCIGGGTDWVSGAKRLQKEKDGEEMKQKQENSLRRAVGRGVKSGSALEKEHAADQ